MRGANPLHVEHAPMVDPGEDETAPALARESLDQPRDLGRAPGVDQWRVDSRMPTVNRRE